MSIDWLAIEEDFMKLYSGEISGAFMPDCLPTNAREWSRFISQWEHIMNLPDDFDPSFEGMTDTDVDALVEEHLNLGHGFKKSVMECMRDLSNNDKQVFARHGVEFDPLKNEKLEIFGFFDRMKAVVLWNGFSVPRLPRHVAGNVRMDNASLSEIPGGIETVGGNFLCDDNHLVSLKGAPRKVAGFFKCSNNPLRTLKGGPEYVGKTYVCAHTNIASLEGAPSKVFSIDASDCENLTSLKGVERVEHDLLASNSGLLTLEGMPQVGFSVIIRKCQELRSLKGIQPVVNGDLSVSDCPITSFDGLERVDGTLNAIRTGITPGTRIPKAGKLHLDGTPYAAMKRESVMSYREFSREINESNRNNNRR